MTPTILISIASSFDSRETALYDTYEFQFAALKYSFQAFFARLAQAHTSQLFHYLPVRSKCDAYSVQQTCNMGRNGVLHIVTNTLQQNLFTFIILS